ncbi:hypothetical protein BTO30_12525 [Domibacillus antri]|uniref:Uncharacterized protein n=1 Tax=Domibacillus antri TaxID=1714264 RepID=A0A1Q8Q3C3_9BACI|nr:hypothetical protein [Domibacillus antri]OLN21840.1 hypothetical protein BTO30_12525 [Domibacillus antri]
MSPNILKEYIEGDFQVTEYTRDGQSVSHTVKVPVQVQIPAGETIPVPPTFEQRLASTEEAITALLGL